jgi:hypothetical protein
MKIHLRTSQLLAGFLFLGILLIPVCAGAQGDDKRNNFQKDFNDFKSSIDQQFDNFVQHNDSVFVQFLSQSWKEFLGVQNPIPTPPKPIQQPKVGDPVIPDFPDKKDSIQKTPASNIEPIIPVPIDSVLPKTEAITTAAGSSSFMFYGSEITIPFPDTGLLELRSLTNEGIINFFKKAAKSSLLNAVIRTSKENSIQCKLNDWGLASLLMTAAQKLYTTRNEQVLFTWYALIRNGFNAKVGYNKERVYLLLPAVEKVYSVSYTINNIVYYLFDFDFPTPQVKLLSIYEADYPGNRTDFSFLMPETPQLGNQFVSKTIDDGSPFDLKLNKNLIDFYNNYPTCELKVFFAAPLSEPILRQLDVYFNPLLKNKDDDERVAFLLNFVQRGIKYQTDQEQFGREKYLFAEETLFYQTADCEDRAILLSKLIRHYTKLATIGLLYPEHVSLAVTITNVPDCKYFTHKNKRYYNCDPTYLGALCGAIMPRFLNSEPEIIDCDL